MEWLLVGIGLAIVVGVFAASRGRSGVGWAFLACLITPLIAGLLVAVLPNRKLEEATQRELAGSKVCPKCAERVKVAATVCRFCGHEFVSGGSQSPVGAGSVSGNVSKSERKEPHFGDGWRP